MVSHKHKCIFVHIPKTGGETITSLFEDNDSNIPKHANARQIKEYLGEKVWSEYFKFTVVRNPYDLVVSMYSHLRKPIYKKEEIISKYGKAILNPINACKTACENNFNVYCEEVFFNNQIQVEQFRDQWSVFHFQPQMDWITNKDEEIIVDFIIRFENFNQDFLNVIKKLKLNIKEIPCENKSAHKHYSKYYSANELEIISKHYSKDIKQFNYSFSDEKNFFDKFKILFRK
ncbi:sulfotransferase family 2 domain-containing protein [uncultured Lutibacter sp.]|uniref:sulfotransferase family 2 domain-containing protein n=1 Tax=uncultured Lutibacter sp. TaxID=437739 RepID=UPI002624BC5B|nr:sulfotransferase family 2 domain-containing protein [uncultured Lutibacter sp.]